MMEGGYGREDGDAMEEMEEMLAILESETSVLRDALKEEDCDGRTRREVEMEIMRREESAWRGSFLVRLGRIWWMLSL